MTSKPTVKKLAEEEKILRRAQKSPLHTHDDLKFPKHFLWGVATSAHQSEGNNIFNDWHAFEQQKGAIYQGQKSGRGADHYHLYKKDIGIIKDALGCNAYRMSIEWSRIEPQQGNYDQQVIEHYHHVFQELKKKKIKISLTLHHFTLPFWFTYQGGWMNHKSIEIFNNFVEFCAKEYGQYVDQWVTINEPMIYAMQCYYTGEWPPARNSLFQAYACIRKLAQAHKAAYSTLHRVLDRKTKKAQVGVAHLIITAVSQQRHSFFGQIYELMTDKIWNHYFLDKTKGYNDFIGINYYLYQRIHGSKFNPIRQILDVKKEKRESSDMGWEIFPQGIYESIVDLADYKLPIYISENGIATRNDNIRVRYIIAYLKEIYHAIEQGFDVRGYFHWSYIDNFEWDKGYSPKFGLVSFNMKTLKRTVKPSGKMYGKIAKYNGIKHDLLKFLGHGIR